MRGESSIPEKADAMGRAVRIYRLLLWVYPRSHRLEYGEWMCQLFRDQCRDALREMGGGATWTIWRRTLVDLVSTAVREHVSEIKRRDIMSDNMAKNSSWILTVVGLAAGVVSFGFAGGPAAYGLFVLSILAIGAKAVVEAFRPSAEWRWAVLSTIVVMFFYGLFMPAWAKLGLVRNSPQASAIVNVSMICLMANPLVAAVKAGMFFLERRKR